MQQRTLAFRSVFISDVHLGSAGCQADSVRHFLDEIECEYLYLVGDIIDIWVAAKSGKWKPEHTNALNTLLRKSEQGVVIRYTPGNHDDAIRSILGAVWGNISVEHSYSHETLAGQKLLVVHGDLFDSSISFKPLAHFGAWIYEVMTLFGAIFQRTRTAKPRQGASFSNRAKKMMKTWIQRVTHFEERITADALNQGYAGVICGHIHKPDFNEQMVGGLYLNCGDWVEHCSAIVEHLDGTLELIFWKDLVGATADLTSQGEPSALPASPSSGEQHLNERPEARNVTGARQ